MNEQDLYVAWEKWKDHNGTTRIDEFLEHHADDYSNEALHRLLRSVLIDRTLDPLLTSVFSDSGPQVEEPPIDMPSPFESMAGTGFRTVGNGRYLVLEELDAAENQGSVSGDQEDVSARGSSASVHRGIDVKTLRSVVIKIPRTAMDSQLQTEVAALRRVHHMGIRSILDVDGDHRPPRYLILEFVEGKTLAEVIARGPDDVPRVVEFCRQIADACAAAHEVGVLHRDLKPANVLIDSSGNTRVVDFGLARIRGEHNVSTAGTVNYLAPERAVGQCDAQSEVFELGEILYESLLSRPFWRGPRLKELEDSPPEELRERWCRIPRPVRDVLSRCLAFSRKKRFTSMQDVSRALKTCQLRLNNLDPLHEQSLYTYMNAELTRNTRTRAQIGHILVSVAKLLASRSAMGQLGVRGWCHLHDEERKALKPIVAFAARWQKDRDLTVEYSTPQGWWVIGRAIIDNTFICENKPPVPEGVSTTEDVWGDLKCVAAHPIRPHDDPTCRPLGTICFDSSLTMEDMKWVGDPLIEETLQRCANLVFGILMSELEE